MFTFRASPCKVMMHEIIMRLFLLLKGTLARMSLLCVLTDQPAGTPGRLPPFDGRLGTIIRD